MSRLVLIADDDPHILEVVSFALEKASFRTVSVRDGAAVLEALRDAAPDLLVLDIGMPEMDGLEVCREIRKSSEVPILFLSSRDEEIDRVLGLELGADDYLTKPFSPRELVARVKAVLKRSHPAPRPEAESRGISHGKLRIEPEKHLAFWDGEKVELTATEFSILCGMARHPDRVFDRNRIMDIAYDDNIHVSDRTIDSHIRNLRQKFAQKGGEGLIQTVHGVGYKISL
jgi:two-component system OmpR family response regulator